jgi:hypothetical protein
LAVRVANAFLARRIEEDVSLREVLDAIERVERNDRESINSNARVGQSPVRGDTAAVIGLTRGSRLHFENAGVRAGHREVVETAVY